MGQKGRCNMKWLNCYRIRLMLVGFIGAFLLVGITYSKGDTITVGSATGYDFDTIQTGIDAAVDGDTVLVAPGEYFITEPITFRGKAITVKSETGRDETTIRMGTPTDNNRGSVIIFENDETAESVLDGFTITGGSGSLVLPNNDFCGGGIFFNASSGTVKNCIIAQNSVKDTCGGVFCAYVCSPILIDCIIEENSAGNSGAGVFPWSGASLNLTNCIIRGNTARGVISGTGAGGGACCYLNSSMTMTGCAIINNTARVGGGIFCGDNSSVVITHSIIIRNTAPVGSGGIETFLHSSATVVNCVFALNAAAGGGGGINCSLNGGSATVTNSIFWENTASHGREILVRRGGSLDITYSSVAGGQNEVSVEGGGTLNWGVGNIEADPMFADPNNGDFHLKSQAGRWDPNSQTRGIDNVTSPCIDTGDPMSPIGLEPFPSGGFVNMGAYGGTLEASKSYFGEPVCGTIVAGDINGDCQVNRTDLEIMALHWTDDVPLPLP